MKISNDAIHFTTQIIYKSEYIMFKTILNFRVIFLRANNCFTELEQFIP